MVSPGKKIQREHGVSRGYVLKTAIAAFRDTVRLQDVREHADVDGVHHGSAQCGENPAQSAFDVVVASDVDVQLDIGFHHSVAASVKAFLSVLGDPRAH